MCGEMFIDQHNGTMRTPDFLDGYRGILNCVWVIATADTYVDVGRITIANESFYYRNEGLLYITIYDGWNNIFKWYLTALSDCEISFVLFLSFKTSLKIY